MPRAVVLLSGGLDSTTTLAVAKSRGCEVFALSVDYGQRHRVELERAAEIARAMGAADHWLAIPPESDGLVLRVRPVGCDTHELPREDDGADLSR